MNNLQNKYKFKRFFQIFIVSIFIFLPSFLLAQDNATANFASSGTLVASALETVGYHAQAQILSSLSEDLSKLGALIYLGVLVSIILTTALMGKYQSALWILIGPPLFVYVSGVELGGSKNRISSTGPEWRLGAFSDPAGFREELVGNRQPRADVSYLFHKYNELISEIFQEVIKVITSSDVNKQLLFMGRQRITEELFGTELTDPKLKSLMQYFLSVCNTEINYSRQVGQGMRDPHFRRTTEYENARLKYCDMYAVRNKTIEYSPLIDFINGINTDTDTETETDTNIIIDSNTPVSCLDLWNWVRKGGKKLIESQLESIVSSNLPKEAKIAYGDDVTERVKNDIRNKINIDNASNSIPDPCPQNFTTGNSEGADNDGFIAASNWLTNIFSALLIRKELLSGPDASGFQRIMAGDYSGVTPYEVEFNMRKANPIVNIDSVRKQKAHQLAEGRRYEAFSLILLFPYLQGVLLYVLSVLYPFFALLLLVPGQANNFLSWLALWAWVKSWDVGWASIMVIDELLWNIMPKNTFHNLSDPSKDTPASLMETHFSGDYAYSTTMYWLLLSSMVSLVPVITAEAILGTKRSLAGLLTSGMTDLASRLSTGAESYTAVKNLSGELQRREADQMIPRAEGLLQMNSQIRQMLGHIDRSAGITGGQRMLQGAANNVGTMVGRDIPNQEERGKNVAAAAQNRKEHEQRRAAETAYNNHQKGLTPNGIASDPTISPHVNELLSQAGLDKEGLENAGISDPEVQARLIKNLADNVVANTLYAYHLKETGDVKLALNSMMAALGSVRRNPFDIKAALQRAGDAAIDTNLEAISMRRTSNNAAVSHLELGSAQILWERNTTPEYYQSEALRAFFSDNRREWFSFAVAPIDFDPRLMNQDFHSEFDRTGRTEDLQFKDAQNYIDQIIRHFSPNE